MTIRALLSAACALPLIAACGGEDETYDETPPQEGELGVGEEEDVNDRASTEASGAEAADLPGEGPPGGDATFEAPDAPSAFERDIVPLTARGTEPGWILEISESTMALEYDYGEQTLSTDRYESSEMDGGMSFSAPDQDLRVRVREERCTAASGMPRPFTVEVRLGERSFQGCGGETERLLTGDAWTVTTLNGEPVVQSDTPPSIRFTSEDIGGSTGCNTYRAAYTLTGETIDIAAGEGTEMACAEDLMAQEDDFLTALEAVNRIRFEGEGVLMLDGETASLELTRGEDAGDSEAGARDETRDGASGGSEGGR
ncbi:MAG: META domain-containing protein [Oceanicaulis sp.]